MEQQTPEIPKKLEMLWTVKQCAQYFGLTQNTIWEWIKKKKVFNPEKIVHIEREIRVPRSEVERIAGIKQEKIISNSMT